MHDGMTFRVMFSTTVPRVAYVPPRRGACNLGGVHWRDTVFIPIHKWAFDCATYRILGMIRKGWLLSNALFEVWLLQCAYSILHHL